MLEVIAVSAVLTTVAKKVAESLAKKASDSAGDTLLSKLKGDPTKKAFKAALAKAVQRYATGERLLLAEPLLSKDGILSHEEVVEELACLLHFEHKPDADLVGICWKAALGEAAGGVDFKKEAELLLAYLEQALRDTDLFRPVFEQQSLDAIASSTALTNESLTEIEGSLTSLAGLIDSRFATLTRTFSQASPRIQDQIIDFTTFIQDRTRRFVGRQFVFDAFRQFTESASSGYFLVFGDPGIGKSALSAQLVRTHGYVHHFNIRAQGINTATAFLQNVCAQLIASYGLPSDSATPKDSEASQNSAFLDKLLRVAADRQERKKICIVVDALDEVDNATRPPGVNPLYLPTILPEKVFIFATARKDSVQIRLDCQSRSITIGNDSEQNTADIEEYIRATLERPGIQKYILAQNVEDTTFVNRIREKSEGNFMYLRYVLNDIENGAYKDLSLDALPSGLRNYYEDHWARMRRNDEAAWFQYNLPVLMALSVAKLPVSVDLLSSFSGVSDRPRIRAALLQWSQFLHTSTVEDAGQAQTRYRLYHESFIDFIASKEEVKDERASRLEANRKITEVLWQGFYGNE